MKLRHALLCLTLLLPAFEAAAFDLGKLADKAAKEKLKLNSDESTPDGSVPLTGNMSDADEEKLGREIAGRMFGALPLVKDDRLQAYVNRVGRHVAAQGSRPDINWTFAVVESPAVNAFAAPGGYVIVTRGLYAMLQSEAELAGVLAHEIAHVNSRHHVKVLQKQRLVAMGRDALLKKAQGSTVQALAGNGAEIFARSLDKNAEFEADRLGVVYAARAGYDPFALAAVLDRLNAGGGEDDRVALLYKTHPHPAERLKALDTAIGSRFDALPAGATLEQRLVKLPAAQ